MGWWVKGPAGQQKSHSSRLTLHATLRWSFTRSACDRAGESDHEPVLSTGKFRVIQPAARFGFPESVFWGWDSRVLSAPGVGRTAAKWAC